jgi:hypothetical protein
MCTQCSLIEFIPFLNPLSLPPPPNLKQSLVSLVMLFSYICIVMYFDNIQPLLSRSFTPLSPVGPPTLSIVPFLQLCHIIFF